MIQEAEAVPQEDRKLYFAPNTIRNCVLTWLIPGLGYYLTGRKKACLLMTSALFGAIIMGALQGGDLYPLMDRGEGWFRWIGSACQLGMGIPVFLLKLFGFPRGTPLSLTYDYGTIYFLIAGMINWLSIMDIFDISVRRK